MFEERKIVQISTSSETIDTYGYIVALCDDGTLWRIEIHDPNDYKWQLIKPIPQDDVGGKK